MTKTTMHETVPGVEVPGTGLPPVVLDLGRTKRKLIRALKKGEGELMVEIAAAVEAVRTNLGAEVEGKVLTPVVIIYERRIRRRTGFFPFNY
jgi:Family of unknown function (DUF6200)